MPHNHVANRMLGDLEYRGHVRPATEECNLAANHNAHDVTAAEFIRTFKTGAFYGSQLLQRLRREAKLAEEVQSACHRLRILCGRSRLSGQANISFDDRYGFRGGDPRVYYLNPWEFTKWWALEPLRAPTWYGFNQRSQWTTWTAAGNAYQKELAQDQRQELPAPKPGDHYVVVESTVTSAYVAFPDCPETSVGNLCLIIEKLTSVSHPLSHLPSFPSPG